MSTNKPTTPTKSSGLPENVPADTHHESDLVISGEQIKAHWDNYGGIALVVILAVVVAYMLFAFMSQQRTQAHEQAWGDLAFATSPEGFRETALTHDDPVVRALANLQGADLLMVRVLEPEEKAEPDTATEADADSAVSDIDSILGNQKTNSAATENVVSVEENLKEAESMYQRVLDDKTLHKVYHLNANLGLATVAETRGQWDNAAALYETIIAQAGDAYPSIASSAVGRKSMIDRMKSPLIFAPAAKPDVAAEGDPEAAPEVTSVVEETAQEVASEATAPGSVPESSE